MWQCSECEYFNDDFDELCAKCGAAPAGASSTPEPEAESAKVAAEADAAPSAPPDNEKPKAADRLLVGAVAMVVIAICAVGYVAYSKGAFPGIKTPAGSSNPNTANSQAGNPAQAAHFSPVEELEEGLILPRALSGKLAAFTAKLEEAWSALSDKVPAEVQPGQLSDDSLSELSGIGQVGNGLVLTYQEFEAYLVETSSPFLNEAAVLMRGQFSEAFGLLVSTVSNYRAHDLNGIHETYLLADSVPNAVEEHGWLDGQPYRQMWVDARHAVKQIELDLQYEEHYRQLAARYDGLEQVHNEFNGIMKQIPPTKVRGGTIGKDAKTFLEALEAYAIVVEGFALEFEEYVVTLKDIEPSDKLGRYIAMNRELAQEDHLFCFMEMYKMYAKDKKLEHPVYANLDARFAFVEETWPKLAYTYQGIYGKYEQEWLRFWRPDLLEE